MGYIGSYKGADLIYGRLVILVITVPLSSTDYSYLSLVSR